MKAITLIASLLLSCAAMAQQRTVTVKVTNSWSERKVDAPVVVDLNALKKQQFTVGSATVTQQGRAVPCQLDDMNGDLRYDELVWLADVEPHATVTYTVTLSADTTQAVYPERTKGSLILRDRKDIHPQLVSIEAPGESNLFNDVFMHGTVIESELVGWRVYMDKRQNLDLYGKKHRRIEIPATEFYTTAEQLADGYGVDVLWAGGAVGCGTFRGWADGPTLIEDVKRRGQRLIASGPVRTVVELTDLGWKVTPSSRQRVNMRQRYTQYAGHRDMQIDIMLDGLTGEERFCTGVQKVGVEAPDSVRKGHQSVGYIDGGVAASWGCDYPDMGKKQLWPPQAIGLATCVSPTLVESQSESDLNYLMVLNPSLSKSASSSQSQSKSSTITYHTAFCADLEQDGYHTASEWFAWVKQWQEDVKHTLKVVVP